MTGCTHKLEIPYKILQLMINIPDNYQIQSCLKPLKKAFWSAWYKYRSSDPFKRTIVVWDIGLTFIVNIV